MKRTKKQFAIAMAACMVMTLLFTCPTASAVGDNLLKNPGFQDDFVTAADKGWKKWVAATADQTVIVNAENPTTAICGDKYTETYTASPNGGNYLSTPDKPNGLSSSAGVQQYITTFDKGQYYEFSAWYKYSLTATALSATSKNAKALVNVRTGEGSSVNYSYITIALNNTEGNWTKTSAVFYVPEDATRIALTLYSGKATENYTVFWDGVDVHAIGADVPNFIGAAGNMADTRTITVGEQPVAVPSHVKVFNGYATGDTYSGKYGVLGTNYMSDTETHDGKPGTSLKMITTGSINRLAAVIDFQCAFGKATGGIADGATDCENFILTGYLKTTGSGYARIREGENLRAPAGVAAEYDTDMFYTNGNWEKIAVVVPANDGKGHTLQFDFVGTGSVLVDDLVLTPYNPLYNGNCEAVYGVASDSTAAPIGFVASDATVSLTQSAHSGKYAWKVDGSAATGTPAVTLGATELIDSTFEEGATYMLSYWQKFETENAAVYAENSLTFIAGNEMEAFTSDYRFPIQSTDWVQCVVYFNVLSTHFNVASLTLRASGASVFYLDDIEITPVSGDASPATSLYTQNGTEIFAPVAGDIDCTCYYAAPGAHTYMLTAVYTITDGVRTMTDIAISEATATTSADGVYLTPARTQTTVTATAQSVVESMLWNAAQAMQPLCDKMILGGVGA